MTLDEMKARDGELGEQIGGLEAELTRRRETKISAIEKELSALKRERKALDQQMYAAWKAEQAAPEPAGG